MLGARLEHQQQVPKYNEKEKKNPESAKEDMSVVDEILLLLSDRTISSGISISNQNN